MRGFNIKSYVFDHFLFLILFWQMWFTANKDLGLVFVAKKEIKLKTKGFYVLVFMGSDYCPWSWDMDPDIKNLGYKQLK